MKKITLAAFLTGILGLFFSFQVQAQIVANDDLLPGSYSAGSTGFNIYANDTVNGNAVNSNNVTTSTVSTTNAGIFIQFGTLYIGNTVPAGTYTLVYRICIPASSVCDTATVTVTVCSLPTPLVTTPTLTCSVSPSVTLSGLPATGNWTVTCRRYSAPDILITGTGTATTFNLAPGSYNFNVINDSGCHSSFGSTYSVGFFQGQSHDGSLTGTYQDTNNDGAINLGDRILLVCSITNTLDCPITITVFDEASVVQFIGGTTVTIAPGETNTSVTGYYLITQDDINAGMVNKWLGFTGTTEGGSSLYSKEFCTIALNIPDGVQFNAFIDSNFNGIQDGMEVNFTEGYFTYELNDDNVIHNFYSNNGSPVIYESNPDNTFDVAFTMTNNSCQFQMTTAAYDNISVPAGSGLTVYNFPVTPISCLDVSVSLYSSFGNPRPGSAFRQTIDLANFGSQTIPSGTLTFTKDDVLIMGSVTPPGTVSITPTGFTFDFVNLGAGQHRLFEIIMQVPALPIVALGQQITNSASAIVTGTDANSNNNEDILIDTITNSYDPNDKMENHGGEILFSDFSSNDYLTYSIRFENTGTAAALEVDVEDVLDAKLDETSIRMVSASHFYSLDRVGNNLSWHFPNINLPPSTNPGNTVGKGYIIFQVKPKPGYAVGDIIPNTASIYFDTNPAIVTNTFETEFVSTLVTTSFEKADFTVYPNPTKDIVTILSKSNTMENVTVNDILGKTVLFQAVQNNSTQIDLSGLSNGMYFIKINAGSKQQILKVIKD